MLAQDLLTRLADDGRMTAETAADAGWDSAVPGLTWDVRTVVTHLGAVHRWCADLVARRLATNATGGSVAFWPPAMTDAELAPWLRAGLDALVETLRSAPADLVGYTMLDDVPARDFWIRRQAHETAIHRADVQAAAGRTPGEIGATLAPDFAQDGLVELVGGFAREAPFAAERPGLLVLRADDGPDWWVRLSPDGNTAQSGVSGRDLGPGDATVYGPSAQLYLWAWNRPAEVTTDGDPEILAGWRRVAIS